MMSAAKLYPEAWQHARQALQRSNQAILFSGRAGLGKTGLAMALAAWALCEANPLRDQAEACGQCLGCRLVAGRQHPDWQWLTLPRKRHDMQVWWSDEGADGNDAHLPQSADRDQIRLPSLKAHEAFMNLSASRGGLRILLINPIDAMNRNAANALLKILEEPNEGLQFILLADQLARVPATIKSRARVIPVHTPAAASALTWLSERSQDSTAAERYNALFMAGGAPVLAQFWLDQRDWLHDWQLSLQETQGLIMMDWAEKLAAPIKKNQASRSAAAKKPAAKKPRKNAAAAATPTVEPEEDAATVDSGLGLDTALGIFQRKIVDRLWQQFNLSPPFAGQNERQAPADPLPPPMVHKLFQLHDEVVFFRRQAVFTPNAQQVLERLLLQWAQIRVPASRR